MKPVPWTAWPLPLQVLQQLGCHTLVQTNAAGSVRPDMPPQSLMLISRSPEPATALTAGGAKWQRTFCQHGGCL
jgi:hypothetical protein